MPVEYDPRRPRLPRELACRVDGVRGQVPFNRWVVRALEAALDGSTQSAPDEGSAARGVGAEKAPCSPLAVPASPRTPEPRAKTIADVDPVLKDPRPLPPGVSKGTAGVEAPYRCRIESCNLRTTSPAASCGKHGGKVVPND